MAYVPSVKYDVFISYRRVDDEFSWVELLDGNLKKLLNQQRRPEAGETWQFEFFRDKRDIPRNTPFPADLETAVKSSAVLLVVMSKGYLATDSNWCQRERELFFKETIRGVPAAKRVFVVRCDAVDHGSWPGEIRDHTGYDLFEKTDNGIRPVSMDFKNLGGRPPDEFARLGTELLNVLDQLRCESSPPPPPAPSHEFVDSVAILIRPEPDAVQAIQLSFADGKAVASKESGDDEALAVAKKLLSLDFESCLTVVDRAHDRLSGGGRYPKSDAMTAVNAAGDWLLGAVYDGGVISTVRDATSGARAIMFEFPAATSTMAEIILAGAQRRAAAFRDASNEEWQPRGVLSIDEPPVSGRDQDGDKFVQDFVDHVIRSLNLVTGELLKTYPTQPDRIKLVNARLNAMQNNRGARYYYVFHVIDEQTPPESWWRSVTQRLSDLFPPIVFLKLRWGADHAAREVEQLYPVSQWKTRPTRPPERS